MQRGPCGERLRHSLFSSGMLKRQRHSGMLKRQRPSVPSQGAAKEGIRGLQIQVSTVHRTRFALDVDVAETVPLKKAMRIPTRRLSKTTVKVG